MTHYKLRITLTNLNPTDVLELLDKQGIYCYVYETGKIEEHPHYHIYLITKMKNDTLRSQYRKMTGSKKGNQLYSLKELDVDEKEEIAVEYLAYMMKEGTVKYIGEWSETAKASARTYDERVKLELKAKKEAKKSRYTKITESFLKDKEELEATGDALDSNYIIKWVIEFFKNEKCMVSTNTIESWCNTLLLKHLPSYQDELHNRVMKRLYDIR